MKRIAAILTALALMAALTACGGAGGSVKSSGGPEDSLPLSEVRSGQLDEELTLTTEWPSYASLDTTVYAVLRNNSGETVTTGSPFSLEVDLGGGGEFSWFRLRPKENVGWTAIGYAIAPGGSMAFACHLSTYDTSFLTGGHFRIVKEIGERTCTAEFTVSGDAAVSAERPYGFAALNQLPADYGAEAAIADGCMVFQAGEEAANASAMDLFLEKVGLEIPCQLRMVRFTTEGAPVVEDIIYEYISGVGGRFSWQRDDSRDGMDANPRIGPVFYYSYLQTDGWSIFLSNAVEWDHSYGQPGLELLAGLEAEPYIAAVHGLTQKALESNAIRCRVWSPDGTQNVGLTEEPLEFSYGRKGYGIVHSLTEYDGLEQEIESVGWLDDHTVILRVRELDPLNSEGRNAVSLWDVSTERLTTGEAGAVSSIVDPRDI